MKVMRTAFCAALLLILLFILDDSYPANAQSATDSLNAGNDSANTISLNGVWKFALAANPTEAVGLARFYDASFDARGFRPIPVPSNWAMHGFEEPSYDRPTEAEGFYLYRFRVPASLADKRALLHFDGVWSAAEVWLNAQRLGRHDSGFTGFAFDITAHLRSDGENTLAVRVRQHTKDSSLDSNDDWALGGIYRGVWLELMPRELYIDRIEAVTDFDEQFRDADLRLRVLVVREKDNDKRGCEVRAILMGADGTEVQRASFTSTVAGLINRVREHNARDVLIEMHVRAPRPWTAETPNLYKLRVELLLDGNTVHTRTSSLGFREISTSGSVLRLNGRLVKLRGVCRHDEHPNVGRATRHEHWLEDIRLMKAANINAVRTSHYPPAEGFIRLCDELGLYVIDEVPMGYGGDLMHDPSFASAALLRAYETVTRDRNHPSVIVWSIGNEDPLTTLHLAVIRSVKGMDPTRPVLMPIQWDESLPPELDILAPHYKTADEYDRMAAQAHRPIITTEYTHALGEGGFGGLEDRWRALTKHPAGAGGMIWHWADQGLRRQVRGRPVLDPIRDLSRYRLQGSELVSGGAAGADEVFDSHGIFGTDGIVNADRTPQRDYWETKAVYAPVTVLADELQFKSGQTAIAVPVRNDFDFTNLDSITIRWRLMVDERVIAAGDARLNVPPQETGSLEIPTRAIQQIEFGAAYYVHLIFCRADGSEIIRRGVRLATEATTEKLAGVAAESRTVSSASDSSRPRVSKSGPRVIVNAGSARYEFDSQTGLLAAASLEDRVLIRGSRPGVWRPLSLSEVFLYGRGHGAQLLPPNLDRYTGSAGRFEITESSDEVRIKVSDAIYRVDDRNCFLASYDWRIDRDGKLRVEYTIKPQVEIGWLPEVGIELETPAYLNTLRWLGLGPIDAYPNERSAAIFGVWSGRAGTDAARGLKADVLWAELTDGNGAGLRVSGSRFVRLDGAEKESGRLRLLTAVVGRSTKFNPPELPSYRLVVSSSSAITGGFTISMRHNN